MKDCQKVNLIVTKYNQMYDIKYLIPIREKLDRDHEGLSNIIFDCY